MDKDVVAGLSPNIRKTVAWLNENGFETCDSGDGSNFAAGMEGALEFPHVFISCSNPMEAITESLRLTALLQERGPIPAGVSVEVNYSPLDNIAMIGLYHYDDSYLESTA